MELPGDKVLDLARRGCIDVGQAVDLRVDRGDSIGACRGAGYGLLRLPYDKIKSKDELVVVGQLENEARS